MIKQKTLTRAGEGGGPLTNVETLRETLPVHTDDKSKSGMTGDIQMDRMEAASESQQLEEVDILSMDDPEHLP